MAEFRKVAAVSDLGLGTAKVVVVGEKQIALFNIDGMYHAIDDTCPHRGGPLSEGLVEGESVSCPWHGSKFNLKTGAVETAPAHEGVSRYNVRVRGSDIEIEV